MISHLDQFELGKTIPMLLKNKLRTFTIATHMSEIFLYRAWLKKSCDLLSKLRRSLEGMQFARTIKASLISEGGLLVIIY